MNIKDIVTLAKHSEMSAVAIKNDVDAVVAFINLGMLELHKRFPIKVGEHNIVLVEGTSDYAMPINYMYPLAARGEIDTKKPLTPNPIAINDEDSEKSIFFNDWNTVHVPPAIVGSFVAIKYVAKPVSITSAQMDDSDSILDLPETLIDALLNYVGYRAHLGVKSDAQSENNAHWARFERSCNKARELGVAYTPDSMGMPSRVVDRGFI